MVKQKTTLSGRTLNHPKGFLNRGLVFDNKVFPVLNRNQDSAGGTVKIVAKLNKKNRKANLVSELEKVLESAKDSGKSLEGAYKEYYKELFKDSFITTGKTDWVSIIYEKANNDLAKKIVVKDLQPFVDFSDVVRLQEEKPGSPVAGAGPASAPPVPPAPAPAPAPVPPPASAKKITIKVKRKKGIRGRTRSRSPPPPPSGGSPRPPSIQRGRALSPTPPQPPPAPEQQAEPDPPVPQQPPPVPQQPAPPPVVIDRIAKQTETSDQIQMQIRDRLEETEGTGGLDYSRREDEGLGLDKDDIEDTGIHNEAIQKTATANDYDFSYTKQSLLTVNPLPNDKATLRKMGEKCIREYGFLLNILEPKDNYSKREVEELYTLKHILKQVISLETGYKRAILKLRIGGQGSGSGLMDGGLSDLMNSGKLGLVLNSDSLNLSPQQLIQGARQVGGGGGGEPPEGESKEGDAPEQEQKEGGGPAQPAQPTKPAPPPLDIFKELNKDTRIRKRISLKTKRKPKKAVFKNIGQLIEIRGRVEADVDYQNLRSEAERINQNPIPLLFKSRVSSTPVKIKNRFTVNY